MPRLSRPPLRVWVWTAATLALVVVAALLWRGSDAAATESTTAAPADVPSGTPAGAVSEAWSAEGGAMPETVVQSGRVLVTTAHGIRALDPLTGEEAWHYTRSNARLCGATVTDGLAVAVFATGDRCDEAVALRAGTGVRAWTRSLSLRGDARLDSTTRIVLATSPTGLVTLDPTGNNIRWRYAPPQGCRLLGADVGNAGVAVLLECADDDAVQLRLLDGFQGDEHWARDLPAAEGAEVRLLGADGLIGVLVGDEVQALAPEDGALRARLPASEDAAQLTVGAVALFRSGGTLSALDAVTGAPRWESPALGLPAAALVDKDDATPGALLVPDAEGFAHRDPATGAELARSSVDGLPEGGVATGIGPVVVYRLPDRVLAYR
ncbi:outer membrane protein assembly factor BamB family protein [Blastococcus sp. PRF04-17]|uniref:outer membrane protein assembly factor BamB family protein n=1 Tax=Blastococcus sp. PRF04-17 TaxID=2933797 RepID=UPI001FF5FCDD|nr:PQQ-binding-like beta-propeller repeat protein [Blastococcus sp. PRF04-17]UOY01281.1 PQQ-binding-like beta-propeller repeat protein [Blastococcus sp. PRF04-17]